MHLFLLCPSLSHRLTVTLPPVSDSQRSQWSSSCLWGCLSMHFITMVISVLLFAEDNRRVPELASTFVPPPPQSPSLLPRPWPPPLPHSDPQRSRWSLPPPASTVCTAATCPVGRPALLTLADHLQVPWLVSGLPVLPLPAPHLHNLPRLLSLYIASLVIGSLSMQDRASVILCIRHIL